MLGAVGVVDHASIGMFEQPVLQMLIEDEMAVSNDDIDFFAGGNSRHTECSAAAAAAMTRLAILKHGRVGA